MADLVDTLTDPQPQAARATPARVEDLLVDSCGRGVVVTEPLGHPPTQDHVAGPVGATDEGEFAGKSRLRGLVEPRVERSDRQTARDRRREQLGRGSRQIGDLDAPGFRQHRCRRFRPLFIGL